MVLFEYNGFQCIGQVLLLEYIKMVVVYSNTRYNGFLK